MLAINR